MLELKGVSYRYAGYAKAVLQDLDLTLADGEIVGLVGPNEAGKSTLCLVAAGLAPASIGGALTGTLHDRRRADGRAEDARAREPRRRRLPEPEHAAFGDRRDRSSRRSRSGR